MTSSPDRPLDGSGKTLLDYPRPSVAVDTALLTVHDGALKVLLVRRPGPGEGWALPGTFVHPGERLADAVLRSLREKAGVTGRSPRQLHVFDEPDRDNRGWVLSVAHVDVVPEAALIGSAVTAPRAKPQPVIELVEIDAIDSMDLPYDHGQIIGHAVTHIRGNYKTSPDPGGLLTGPFTLKELREVHESVLGEPLQRDTFRRTMERQLSATGAMSDGTKGRPAALFVSRGAT
ncbi:NUDIX domain-containing protein [Arthrobacter sp. STN4]|uniref:NUDIX hydrolase n=1 Tax=Arthrobacter sp. STN4 TaxID=2923276 RepID=UPI00211A71B7|nr:NUDIX domain-containing protein [Arthrobacter sp. STN4]MCQ9164910.1 NUDIX hydrolase [Arthrobacter sp. STN4]